MTPAFNLLDEPWIPARTHEGEVLDISLSDALLKACDYAALAETSPPNLIALYRLLLAMLHRALTTHQGKWTDKDRARWVREGLPEAPIRAYVDQWRERFWLFHPTNPFMQVAALASAEETRTKLKPWTLIALEGSSGNTPVMFDHALDERPKPASCSIVFCHLLGFLQFTPGGLVKTVRDSDKAGALANTAAVVPVGRDLSETLLLGLHPYGPADGDDLPSWERSAPTVADLRAEPTLATGPNDRYSRQSRAVLLDRGDQPADLSQLRFAAGVALNEDPNAPDPMACYRINKEGKAIRISFSAGRALWRDLPSLVPDPGHTSDIPPAILGWAANLYEALGDWYAHVPVLTAGLASDQAKLLRWRTERLDLPLDLLTNPDAALFLRTQVRFAESVFAGLGRLFAEMIARTMPDPDHKDTRSRARDILTNGPAAAVFFSAAERVLPKLIRQIAEGEIDAADHDWRAALNAAAHETWNATRRSLGDSPAVMRADALVWPRFVGLLKTLKLTAAETAPTTEEEPA